MFLLVAGPFVSWLPIVAWWPGLAGIKAGHCFLYWGPCFSGGGGPSDLASAVILPPSLPLTQVSQCKSGSFWLQKNLNLDSVREFRLPLNQAERLESNLLFQNLYRGFHNVLSIIFW